MKASELQDLIVRTLSRMHGGTTRRWRIVVGPVRVYDLSTHPQCNWSVAPSGGARETTAVENLLDDIRLSHSIVQPD